MFGAMLRFIYTDELPPEAAAPATAHDLLVAADLYDLERLRLMCERTLWESVLADGVSAALSVLLRVNGRHSCRQLEDLCVGSVAGAWEAATATDEYRELKASCPALLNDILEKVVVSRRRRAQKHGYGREGVYPVSDTYPTRIRLGYGRDTYRRRVRISLQQ